MNTTKKIASVVIIIIIVSSIALFDYSRGSTTSNSHSTTTTISTTSNSATGHAWISNFRRYPNGLEISVEANSTRLVAGQGVELLSQVNNTSAASVTVYPSSVYGNVSNWAYYYESPCGSILPLDMAVFKGHFDSSNISLAGNPLQLIPYQFTTCPTNADVTEVIFHPTNDTANLYYTIYGKPPNQFLGAMSIKSAVRPNGCDASTVNSTCGSDLGELGVMGYYTGSAGTGPGQSSNQFHIFEPGEYTAAVADTWGQIVFLYFEVS